MPLLNRQDHENAMKDEAILCEVLRFLGYFIMAGNLSREA
jgi:hypothetical protein